MEKKMEKKKREITTSEDIKERDTIKRINNKK